MAALCEQCAEGEVLVPANFNCPGQIVIAGAPAAVERAEAAWGRGGEALVAFGHLGRVS